MELDFNGVDRCPDSVVVLLIFEEVADDEDFSANS